MFVKFYINDTNFNSNSIIVPAISYLSYISTASFSAAVNGT